MKNSSKATLAVAPLLLLLTEPSSALVQNGQNVITGMTSTWPLGVLLDGPNFASNGEIRVRTSGRNARVARPWSMTPLQPSASVPNYGTVHKVTLGGVEYELGIDAHSTGNAVLPRFEGQNRPFDGSPDPSAWFAICTSLEHDDDGISGSRFQSQATEVVGYYFEESNSLNPTFPGNAFRELTRKALGTNGHADDYVRALDFGVGSVSYNDPQLPNWNPAVPRFYYFSVSPATVAALGAQPIIAATSTSLPHPAHAGDIYRRTWLGTHWGEIELFVPHEDLGLRSDHGDVDGLELDVDGFEVTIIFSADADVQPQLTNAALTLTSPSNLYVCIVSIDSMEPNPLLHGPMSLKDGPASGTKVNVTNRIMIQDPGDLTSGEEVDDVGGICCIDPETFFGQYTIGVPVPSSLPLAGERMGISIARGLWADSIVAPTAPTLSTVSVTVSGWAGLSPAFSELALFRKPVVGSDPAERVGEAVRFAGSNSTTFHIEDIAPAMMPGESTSYENYRFYAVIRPFGSMDLRFSMESIVRMAIE